MENPSSNFVELSFNGIDDDCFCQGLYKIKSKYFSQIEFINKHTVKFYLINNAESFATKADLEHECFDILLKLYIQLLKEGSYFIGKFEIDRNCTKIQTEHITLLGICDSANVSDSMCVDRHDGLSEKDRLEIEQRRVEKTLSDSFANDIYLSHGNSEKLLKLFQIDDSIIQYFLMYSWLCDLCSTSRKQLQTEAQKFIETSKIYKEIPENQRRRKRIDEQGQERNEDVFTYLRNLIGHSVNDILNLKDKLIAGEIETFKRKLMLILLEKLRYL